MSRIKKPKRICDRCDIPKNIKQRDKFCKECKDLLEI